MMIMMMTTLISLLLDDVNFAVVECQYQLEIWYYYVCQFCLYFYFHLYWCFVFADDLVAFAVGIAAFLPGLPTITLILVACAFAAAGYFSAQKQLVKSNIDVEEELIQDEQNTVMDIGFSTELWDEIDQPMKNEINTQFDRFKQSFEKKYGKEYTDKVFSN